MDRPGPESLLAGLTAARGDWVRLRTLLTLRWLAAGGQTAAVVAADRLLHMQLPVGLCFGAIAASVCVNIVAQSVHPASKRLSERDTALTLLFDLAQLGVLLFLTGGLTNPFAVLALAPVIISATALTLRTTLLLGAFAMLEFSLLAVAYIPLTFADGSVVAHEPVIVFGVWAAMLLGVVFLAGYARRVTAELWAMSQAVAAAEEALGREQRLTAIGGLAAAAAHELGTPLATIKLVSGELARELKDDPELAEDVELIRKQADRCRDILRELSEGGKDDRHVRTAPVYRLVEEAAEPHLDRGKTVILRLRGRPLEDASSDQPEVERLPETIHGLRNLIQNAVDFADARVWVDVDWTDEELRIAVGDDGPGFGGDLLGRLGDPFLRNRRAARGDQPRRRGYEGMGLGLFIAKTLLERTGAVLTFANGAEPEVRRRGERAASPATARPSGAIVQAAWPRGAIDRPRDGLRPALGPNPSFAENTI
ncbi:MAG: ActS/PrrB/RegB family redox-sensitive histidine kinase [Pseudomonadota bacterium]